MKAHYDNGVVFALSSEHPERTSTAEPWWESAPAACQGLALHISWASPGSQIGGSARKRRQMGWHWGFRGLSSKKVWTVWQCSLSRGATYLAKPQPRTGVTFHYILETHRTAVWRASKPPWKFLRNCLGSAEREKKSTLFTSRRRKVVTNTGEHRCQAVTAHLQCCDWHPCGGGCFLHNLPNFWWFNINTRITFSTSVCRKNNSGQDVSKSHSEQDHVLPCACTRCWPCQQQHL